MLHTFLANLFKDCTARDMGICSVLEGEQKVVRFKIEDDGDVNVHGKRTRSRADGAWAWFHLGRLMNKPDSCPDIPFKAVSTRFCIWIAISGAKAVPSARKQ